MVDSVLIIADLLQQLTALEAVRARLGAENARLQAAVDRLQAENVELRRRLGLNSSNSHQPLSRDG